MQHLNYDNLKVQDATIIQNSLRDSILLQPRNFPLSIIAGADISFNKFSTTVYAGIILLSFPDLLPIGYSLIKKEVLFPYVPGYLAFREVPPLMDAWENLPQKPDLLVVDGHGIAHPRRMGIASHFGVSADTPTIGCAKTLLCGQYEEPASTTGSSSPLIYKNEVVGAVLRTKNAVKPVFVSPGHKIDVPDSVDIIKQCIGRYRIPEPTRLAHNMVNQFRLGEIPEGYTALTR
ncbi:deoxyribonuclease V [Chitinophaga pinensis]|uniref:Endonuclease V n=1 Tax=Chitinophaga pinensis (strain ATCC 43595 / DSM 2588 / LMG 13176 / NBRC 15968 / NCIMB 11800 / UQM 2034) TaxID=485918 RepID=A0A979GXZ2_CHIPD|nr:deoxyribonuclease V [Chitinophaga pinensis]ACU61520.1 Deoxyribonuclease V [Chitinophaga pinensis DSM 2588]